MAHPHCRAIIHGEAAEQGTLACREDLVAAILPLPATCDLGAREVCDHLHAVADAEHRYVVEKLWVGEWGVRCVHGVRAAAEDDAGGIPRANPLEAARGRVDL